MQKLMKFGLVGVFNTLITIGSYILLLQIGINYIFANVLGYVLGVLNSFYWNKRWVFKVESSDKAIFFKFVVVNIISLSINTLILYIIVNFTSSNYYIAQILATGFGLVTNFYLNNKWTFLGNKK
jgi:putative flippase GtrA